MRPFQQLPFGDVPDLPRVPHPYFETPSRTVRVPTEHFGEVDAHVRVAGSGPPLLLVHGFMTSSYSFRYVIGPLAERFTVYVPDLVGAGRSGKPDRSYGPDAVADWIAALVRSLGIEGTACVGNSLGGYLAMRAVLRHERIFSRLVNLHSPGVPTPRMWALRAALAVVPATDRIVRGLVWRDPERWVHRNVHYWDETLKSREEHREYAAPLRTQEGVRAFYRMLDETLDPRAMRRFVRELEGRGRFPVPLLLLYAKKDPMVPPSVGRALRELLPDARFEEIAEGSHFAHVDAPAAFLGAVVPFLGGEPK